MIMEESSMSKMITRVNYRSDEVQLDIRDRLDSLLRLKQMSINHASRLMNVSDITLSKFFRGLPLSYMALIKIEDFLIMYGNKEIQKQLHELEELGLDVSNIKNILKSQQG